ncbi:hypothetical protein H4I95_05046 [Botrytis cinerea]
MMLLQSVFNHLVLPPKLPEHQDVDLESIEQDILLRLIHACGTMYNFTDQPFGDTWKSVCNSLRICLNVNRNGLDKASMLQEFCNLQRNVLLILYVVEQNAALLVRRHVHDDKDTVIFEVFEASPSSKHVLATENALQWDFPGRAVGIPFDEFLKESFQDSLASFLEQASTESLSRFVARSNKAEVHVVEARGTTDPALIVQMLMPLLEAIGSSVEVPRLRKRVRDDVNFHNAESPWRRLPFWLILRVAIQRQLCLDLGTKAKLCRRLAKLEMDKARVYRDSAVHKHFFDSINKMLKKIIKDTTDKIESAWANFKTNITRSIPLLPTYADEKDLNLTLPNSRGYLCNLLALESNQQRKPTSVHISLLDDSSIKDFTDFTDRYFSLIQLEKNTEQERMSLYDSGGDFEARCIQSGNLICEMLIKVGDTHDSDPEQMSIFILNIFENWVQMDRRALRACPLLCEYAPVFNPGLLDVLQLHTLSNMTRLQDVQRYLHSRLNDCRFAHKTIFSEFSEDCFAAQFVKKSVPLSRLQEKIDEESLKARTKKEREWENICGKYEDLSQKITSTICVCTRNDDGSLDVKGCKKCWHRRCRKRMRISIHEDFLPKGSTQKAAVVLELRIPKFLAVYRNATFRIMSDLGYPSKPRNSPPPAMLLKDYSQLQYFMKSSLDGVSLASEKKSFLQTHFQALKMKVKLSDIILPLGLSFSYYDSKSGIWLKDLDKQLTLQHLCGIHIPRSLRASVIESPVHPGPSFDGPSSYEIIASQSKCPSDISVHEFMSYQKLLSGKTLRWLTMLVELGASNLNFSAEDTMLIFNHLAVQVGPSKNQVDVLRDSTNWREVYCMEMLITLSLRIFELTSGQDHQSAERLLKNARESTLQWICHLPPQRVHYNFVEGHLLLDGKPLGKLPIDIRESEDVKELFGDQHLLTFPSSLVGMSHARAASICGNEVHFGHRGKNVVIQAISGNKILEYVPRRVFTDGDSFDLPSSLIENCVHWLNFHERRLEIRRKPSIWVTRPTDWKLNVSNFRAQRKRVNLVDPHSDLFKRVAEVFRHFEDPRRLTVFQPKLGSLSVEMRHLELSFVVNSKNLLECRELHAEIDPDQDAGTLYGLLSKIVLRDNVNHERRSIIVPLGPLTYRRRGMHVEVQVASTTEYGRFEIDDILGRLSCPSEPRLLYSKAQFHAFTSFILPDPLTGRTGTEEALHTLRSGYCQPWRPLNDSLASILRVIGRLSPIREYYPKDKRHIQRVIWDQHLTATVQHDSFESLVQEILAKSDQLRCFTTDQDTPINFETDCPLQLRKRGEIQRLRYERSVSYLGNSTTADMMYESRDRHANLHQANNVYQIAGLFHKQTFRIHLTRKLADILKSWTLIGGFHHTKSDSQNISSCLSDLIENDIGEQWGSLTNFCRQNDPQEPYKLLFRLSLLSFGTKPDMDAIRSLAAFGCLNELKALQPPSSPYFTRFKPFSSPTLEMLSSFIADDCPVVEPVASMTDMEKDWFHERHGALYKAEGKRLALFLLEQWPSEVLSAEGFESNLLNVKRVVKKVHPEWQRLIQNMRLSEYVAQAQEMLDRHKAERSSSTPHVWDKKSTPLSMTSHGVVTPSLSDLLAKPALISTCNLPDKPRIVCPPIDCNRVSGKTALCKEIFELERILDSFAKCSDLLRKQYGNDLKKSLLALKNTNELPQPQWNQPAMNITKKDIENSRVIMNEAFERIQNALSAGDIRFQWLRLGNLWPCVTPITILEQLRSSSNNHFGSNMRETLVMYGVLITSLQRLLRMIHAQFKDDSQNLRQESQNYGHENWSPSQFPDWLLLEIDSNILIRCEQIDVAHAILSPESRSNSVLQMNMGQGKTSCIVPMAIAILADKKQLSRLVVPKALLLQTAQTIQSRLGSLVGREVRYIPFSRRTTTSLDMLRLYSTHHHEMLQFSGVILTTPEHILSYKLSGLQRLADSRLDEAREMIRFQSWLTSTCRDILDESDFTLAVKTQLIYPSGPQISVDGHPNRWKVAQYLLSLVEDHFPCLQRDFPQSIEVTERTAGFPILHLLREDVEDALHCRIINDVCNGRIPFLRLTGSSITIGKIWIRQVLSDHDIDDELIEKVSALFKDKSSARKNILLVRGLLLNRILLLCLKKRWNVQYGLHPNRDPIAVPFDAKGVPSEQAEFGHPDVSILFTCLAFYYTGLNLSQFQQSLQLVLKSDDPTAEYDRWISSSYTLPEVLSHWNVINIDDQGQLEELWRHLRLNRHVLDHYMNTFVFPNHAKQFSIKLQASGWDIPLFSKPLTEETIWCPKTTGFSGTNDNKMMLPLSIKQDDLPSLCQTNAEVLVYILQSRNRQYKLASRNGRRMKEEELLKRIKNSKIKVLIDAGAYILEMDNKTLVKKWLEIDSEPKAAVYFGDDNRAWVQYRRGKDAVPLLATPFAENLEDCLVYIDEAHTRGVDLKLPQQAHGALTLGLGQTKDHMVQAAMRLRQLGTTQSITFFAPPEVHQSILDVCAKQYGKATQFLWVDSSHVVWWLLEQTCRTNQHLQNLYLAQGTDFCRRTDAQWKYTEIFTDNTQRDAYLSAIQNPEHQSLEKLYEGVTDTEASYVTDMASTKLAGFMKKLNKQRITTGNTRNYIHSSVLEEVEQEREVEFQVEQLGQISVKKYDVRRTKSKLYVSMEFIRTIELGNHRTNDNFLRPIEWILWNPSNETALIVIPEEVELLIPVIRTAKEPMVYLIAYAAPITKSMQHFNGLSYYILPSLPNGYKIPEWLSIEIGIFAGRLYINFTEYAPLSDYLQLAHETTSHSLPNFPGDASIFTKNPIEFLLEWLTLRRKGQEIMHTPMGYICQARSLHEGLPFFASRSARNEELEKPSRDNTESDVNEPED